MFSSHYGSIDYSLIPCDMEKKVLVTGGAGYVGSIVVNMLLDRGYRVIVLDKLLYGRKGLDSFSGRENMEFIQGDVTDHLIVEKAIKGADYVIALAAIVGDQACSVNEKITWDINYKSVKYLADLSVLNNVTRFVFTSSCSVYGCNEHIRFLTEESKLSPVSLYAQTRIKSEKYLQKKKDLLSFVILRLSTIFGYSPRMRFDLAVNIMSAKAAASKSLDVCGGDQWRPFVHVCDVARAIILALESDDKLVRGEVFNVGSTDSNYKIAEVADMILEELPETKINFISSTADKRNYNCVFDKIHKKLNYKGTLSVRDGIREVAQFVEKEKPDLSSPEYSNYEVWKKIGKIETFIPYSVPDICDEVREEIVETIESGWLSMGPRTKAFEERIKEYFSDGQLEVIAVSSCTAGLHLQLLAAGVGPGDEVITSPLTFCATVNTILYTRATPVLVDIDPVTFNLDIDLLESAITERTKAIVPVYYAGQAVDHKKLKAIADKHGLLILADAAHAMGAKYDNKFCGTYEDSAAFSFYATKNMPIGEGGIVTTHNHEMADKIKYLLMHGMNRDAWKRFSETGSWYYEIIDLGYKYNFTDMQAAFGLHQLKKLDQFNNLRRKYGEVYDEAFKYLPGMRPCGLDPRATTNRHMYPIVLDPDIIGLSRNQFIEKLKEFKIGTSVHYIPIHHHPFYQKNIGLDPEDFPVTNKIFKGLLSLPIYTKLTIEDVNKIISRVTQLVESNVKIPID
jgi:dTDP-4-amino-4,6-dideoxygalactose transaminase/nucleoside-diphosphate-sugar epimerase